MASSSRFEGQQVVNSINFFVDSERCSVVGDGQSKGDDIHYNFEGNTIECKDGEVIRLSLVDFYMPNNQYTIDGRNSFASIICSVNGTAMSAAISKTVIDRGNYYEVDDIAINFAKNIGNIIAGLSGVPAGLDILSIRNVTLEEQLALAEGFTNVAASTTAGSQTLGSALTGTPERKLLNVIIKFKSTATAGPPATAAAHTITNLKISCQSLNGEAYLVLGGERGDDSTTNLNSFTITYPSSSEIQIKGYYPMQLVTEPHVYLRCTLGQNGLESSILSTDDKVYNNDIVGSNILAKIPRTTESFSFIATQEQQFFLTLQQRKLNSIGLFLTDSKSRPIGRAKGSGRGTSAGLEDTTVTSELAYLSENQSTLGNLYFTATIRIDIVKVYNPNVLQSEPPPMPPVPRKANGIMSFGSPTGFK
jgi:hypothetical protein